MKSNQKGAIGGLAIALIILIILALIGIGIWWHHDATSTDSSTATSTTATTTGYSYSIGSATSTSVAAPTTQTQTVTRTTEEIPVTHTHTAAPVYTGNTYHNSTYGLTIALPASMTGFRTYVTAGGPAGLPGTAMIHFVAPGEATDAFVVNVFSKAQWNAIRTEENFAHLNTPNLGEGNYLGENFTWIYSDNIYSHVSEAQPALAGAVFY